MRVLVTGATGFAGSHICEQLAAAGHVVVAMVRENSDVRFLSTLRNVVRVRGDLLDVPSLRSAVRDVDGIVHSAGLIKANADSDYNDVNVNGTANLVAEAVAAGHAKRLVLVSSLAALGPAAGGVPLTRDTAPLPTSAYGRSKLEAERVALKSKDRLRLTILRPPMIYGPRDTSSFKYFRAVSTGFMPYLGGWGDNKINVLYSADLGTVCLRAMLSDVESGSAYFPNDGEVYVWRDMLVQLQGALGRAGWFGAPLPKSLLKVAAFTNETLSKVTGTPTMLTLDRLDDLCADHWLADARDATRELGWTPTVRWAEGVRLAAAWYRREGWLA